MARRSSAVTIAEVAKEAGVSTATVSIVLNGRSSGVRISEATQVSVREAAARLGYIVNQAARSLRRRRTNRITLLVLNAANPYFIDLALAARAIVETQDYELDVVDVVRDQTEDRALEHISGGISDGVIVATGRHAESDAAVVALQKLVRRGFPAVVLLDRSPDPAIPAILVDYSVVVHVATTHLLSLGHRSIGYLGWRGTSPRGKGHTAVLEQHYRGYRQALADAGLEFRDEWLVQEVPAVGTAALESGRRMMHILLQHPGPRPTSVFAGNDLLAIGALRALYEAGVHVPHEMAVVGSDGIGVGQYVVPALTTVDHPREELGRLAAQTLLDLMSGKASGPRERVLPVSLLVRESCGAQQAAHRRDRTGAQPLRRAETKSDKDLTTRPDAGAVDAAAVVEL